MTTRLSAINFTPHVARLTKDFTGRQWVFDDIARWLQDTKKRFFILTGEPGVGKSTIAANLIQTRKDIVAYHLCQAAELETLKPGRILRSLTAQLMETVPDYGLALLNTIKATPRVQTEECCENLNPSNPTSWRKCPSRIWKIFGTTSRNELQNPPFKIS
jgi:hypothetical protein